MAREPENNELDQALRFDEFLLLPDQFDGWLDEMVEVVLGFHEVRNVRGDVRRNTKTALSILLANLLKASAISYEEERENEGDRAERRRAGGWIYLSLNSNNYVNTRYNNSSLTYRALERAYQFLVSEEIGNPVEIRRGFRDREIGIGRLTRLRLSFPFFHLFFNSPFRNHLGGVNPFPFPSPPVITNITSFFPVSLLVNDLSREAIILKDNDKNPIPYDDTNNTTEMRDRLGAWNRFAQTKWPDILLENDEFLHLGDGEMEEGAEDVLRVAGETRTIPTDLTRRFLYRVFNNGVWEDGGRLYGGWWQHVPSRLRSRITIDSLPTVEIDYSNMQAAMLYARVGLQLPDDAYQLEGINPAYRKLIKRTFFQMINAAEGQNIRAPRREVLPPRLTFVDLQDAITRKHEPIGEFLRTGIGLQLQKLDAEIALDVMTAAMNEGELVLPIHDSFIAGEGYGDRLREHMVACYEARIGREIEMELVAPYRRDFVVPLQDGPQGQERFMFRRGEIEELMQRPEFSHFRDRAQR